MHIKNQVVLNQKPLNELISGWIHSCIWMEYEENILKSGRYWFHLIQKGDSADLMRIYRYHITFLIVVFLFLFLWEGLTELYQLQGCVRSLVARQQRLQSLSGLSIWKHIQHLQGIAWPERPGLSRGLCMSPHCAVLVPGKTGQNPAPAEAFSKIHMNITAARI